MNKNLMVLFASTALALVGCSDKDSGGDSGATDGTDGADGADGADGGSAVAAGLTVTGATETAFPDGEYIGSWAISGATVACGGCDFAFDADFTGPSDFARTVSFEASGGYEYAYTDAGEYWGVGYRDGSGYASWYTYDSSSSGYYYYGYVGY